MSAWIVDAFGVDNLRLEPRTARAPGPGEVRVRVRAVALNQRDLMMVAGAYDPRQALPLVPCSDAVGDVVEAGAGAEALLGTRVCPAFSTTWVSGPLTDAGRRGTLGGPIDGVLQDDVVVPADAVVAVPPHLTDAEAATLPCAGVTAYNALAGVGPGATVLTLGTGGVSLFAAQLAGALGARVALTSRTRHKLDRLGHLAELRVDTRRDPAWGKTVATWAGAGVDVVVELGGDTLEQSLRAVKTGGTVALIGVLGGGRVDLQLTKVFMRGIRLQGVFVGSRDDLAGLCALLDAHRDVRPIVDRVFPWGDAPDAFRYLRAAGHMGKVVIGRADG